MPAAAANVLAPALATVAMSDASERLRSTALRAATSLAPAHPCTSDAVLAALRAETTRDRRLEAMTCLADLSRPPDEALPLILGFLEADDTPAGQLAALRALRKFVGDDAALEKRIASLERAIADLAVLTELSELISAESAIHATTRRTGRASLLRDFVEGTSPR